MCNHLCVYVPQHMCTLMFLHMHSSSYVYLHAFRPVNIFVCVLYLCECIHVTIYVFHMCILVSISLDTHTHLYMCVCIHIVQYLLLFIFHTYMGIYLGILFFHGLQCTSACRCLYSFMHMDSPESVLSNVHMCWQASQSL